MLSFSQQEYRQDRLLFTIENLQLNRGELVVLFGANGSGKSSWLRSIVGPKSAEEDFSIDGKTASSFDRIELAKTISFIDNHFAGLDHLTVEEYISLGRYPYTGISGRLGDEDNQVIRKVTSRLGIEGLLTKSTSSLSDGERQKCGIARALVQETTIILLDEPTSFLDYPSKQELFKVLSSIVKEENKLVIVSTHDIDLGLEFGTKWCIISPNKEFITLATRPEKIDLLQLSFA